LVPGVSGQQLVEADQPIIDVAQRHKEQIFYYETFQLAETLSITALCIKTLSIDKVNILMRSINILGITTLSMTTQSLMTLSKMT
jgi:hypothetical protein